MKHAILDQRRGDLNSDEVADCCALYAGGSAFRARIQSFLPKRPEEGEVAYELRKKTAKYLNYFRPIINYYPAFVFTDRLEIKADEDDMPDGVPTEALKWYQDEFASDVTSGGVDLADFMRSRLTRALVERRSWILVDFPRAAEPLPDDLVKADWAAMGLDRGYLCAVDEAQVLRFRYDDRGVLEWVVIKARDTRPASPFEEEPTITDSWTIWDRYRWQRFEIRYKAGEPPKPETEVPMVAEGVHAAQGRVPVVSIEMPDELWLGDLLRDPQVEQFTSRAALSWGLQRTCHAMRIFYTEEELSLRPTIGTAYGINLGANDKVEWDAPPSDAFVPIADFAATLKDEIYRVANQMALGVENNAAAVGRTAESKVADAASTVVVAKALGKVVREAVERVLDILAAGRGDSIVFDVCGLDRYTKEDEQAIVDTAVTAASLEIPSPTFRRMHAKRVAMTLLPNATEAERHTIAKEIDDNTPDEPVTPPAPQAPPALPGVGKGAVPAPIDDEGDSLE